MALLEEHHGSDGNEEPGYDLLESFFNDIRSSNTTPRANYKVGLDDSISVIMANRAMDEERRVNFSELEGGPAPANGNGNGNGKKKIS